LASKSLEDKKLNDEMRAEVFFNSDYFDSMF